MPWNEPLFETPNFVVLPSLGALVEGWLLLVPKDHFICMGALPTPLAIEMEQVKDNLYKLLVGVYGDVCAFEHGPSRANVSVGCGVDHAHLHLVPVAFDLCSAVAPFLPTDAAWNAGGLRECAAAFNRGEDYLYVEQAAGDGQIATHSDFGSQLLRRAIAARLGVPNQFNWREHPQLANISATIDTVQRALGQASGIAA